MTRKTVREIALDGIDEIGVPVSRSMISDLSLAATGVGVRPTRLIRHVSREGKHPASRLSIDS